MNPPKDNARDHAAGSEHIQPSDFPPTRHSLIDRYDRGKDQMAWAQLCGKYWLPSLAYLIGKFKNADLAQDVVQEQFLKWHRDGTTGFYGDGRFRAWVKGCMRNMYLKKLRVMERIAEREGTGGDWDLALDGVGLDRGALKKWETENERENRLLHDHLRHEVFADYKKKRDVEVYLDHIFGESQTHSAQRLGISKGETSKAVVRAEKHVQAYYENHPEHLPTCWRPL